MLNGKPYDFTRPVTGDLTLTAAWTKTTTPAGPADTLPCVTAGKNAFGPQADNFCWVDFSQENLNDAKWANGSGISIKVPGGTITATMRITVNTAAKNRMTAYVPYKDSGYSALSASSQANVDKTLKTQGMSSWDATWIALWKAYDLPQTFGFPAYSTQTAPITTNGQAVIELTDIRTNVDKGFSMNGLQMAFGDAEVMSGRMQNNTWKNWEKMTITSDKPITELGYALGLGGTGNYGKEHTLDGNTLTIEGGKVDNQDDFGNANANDAIVATVTEPTRFTVDWSQQNGQSGRSAIALGFRMPYKIRQQVTLHYDANGGQGTMTDHTDDVGASVTMDANRFTRTEYRFTGWNTRPDGKGIAYTDKDTIILPGDLTVYAQWQPTTPIIARLPGTGGHAGILGPIIWISLGLTVLGALTARRTLRRDH